MNISTEPGPLAGRLLSNMTRPGVPASGLESFPKHYNVQDAFEEAVQHDSDGYGPVTLELTRQGMGGRHGVDSTAPASSRRKRSAAKSKSKTPPPAPSKAGAPGEDDYFPAKPTGRGAAAKEKEDPVMEHASRHQAAEQRRRNRIKEKLDKLKTRVPHVDPRTNTASFLEAVLRYIDVLQARVNELEAATSAPRSSSSALPQPSISSPTQSEHHDWDEEERHRTRPNGRGSVEARIPAAATLSETAFLLPAQSPCLLPSSNNLLSGSNISSMLGNGSAQPLLLQSQSHNVQMQVLQQQQQQLQQLILQHRLGEFQREQMEQQAVTAMLGLHKPNQQSAADALEQAAAGAHVTNIWPSGVNVGGSVFIMPGDLHLQGYGLGPGASKAPKVLGNINNINTLEALELLANQAGSAGCYVNAAQLAGRRLACMPRSEEDPAPRKRSRK